jgi:glutamate N-acetyltransferase/amino-acid N-acetyltransferase
VVTIEVLGAESAAAAEAVARRIGRSPLVKTAFFGADPNWGRILGAAGTTDAAFDPDKVDVAVAEVEIVRDGVAVGGDAEARAQACRTRRPNGPGCRSTIRRRSSRPTLTTR